METIFFITNRCPLSYNSKNRSRYQDILRTDFSNFISQYPSIPLNASLYSKIIYIYKPRRNNEILDVDNLSKLIVDAFNNIIYKDDKIIEHRICSKIKRENLDMIKININNLPEKIFEKWEEYIESDCEHILYFEVGEFKNEMVKFGGE